MSDVAEAAASAVIAGRAERSRVLALLRAMEPELRRRGVASLRLYGSMARGEAGPASDVDLLVTVPAGRPFSLVDMSAVRLLMADHLGRDIGILVDADLSPAFRARIADDLIGVF